MLRFSVFGFPGLSSCLYANGERRALARCYISERVRQHPNATPFINSAVQARRDTLRFAMLAGRAQQILLSYFSLRRMNSPD